MPDREKAVTEKAAGEAARQGGHREQTSDRRRRLRSEGGGDEQTPVTQRWQGKAATAAAALRLMRGEAKKVER